MDIFVHPRVSERHPELSEEDVKTAWLNFTHMVFRTGSGVGQAMAVGVDGSGRLIEMVAVMNPDGYLVYHAITPPTESALRELGLLRR